MQQANNVSTLIKSLKVICLGLIIALALSNVAWLYAYVRETSQNAERVYVTTDNGTTSAIAAGQAQPTQYEARNLVRSFMELMFQHDASTFRERVNHGMKLVDHNDGRAIYETFKRGQVLENYHRYNSHTNWTCDSVSVDMSVEPYQGIVWGAQEVVYDNQIAVQPVAARFTLSRQLRSDINPYGLLIDGFNFIEYRRPAPDGSKPDVTRPNR
jgi:hypothetical protein